MAQQQEQDSSMHSEPQSNTADRQTDRDQRAANSERKSQAAGFAGLTAPTAGVSEALTALEAEDQSFDGLGEGPEQVTETAISLQDLKKKIFQAYTTDEIFTVGQPGREEFLDMIGEYNSRCAVEDKLIVAWDSLFQGAIPHKNIPYAAETSTLGVAENVTEMRESLVRASRFYYQLERANFSPERHMAELLSSGEIRAERGYQQLARDVEQDMKTLQFLMGKELHGNSPSDFQEFFDDARRKINQAYVEKIEVEARREKGYDHSRKVAVSTAEEVAQRKADTTIQPLYEEVLFRGK